MAALFAFLERDPRSVRIVFRQGTKEPKPILSRILFYKKGRYTTTDPSARLPFSVITLAFVEAPLVFSHHAILPLSSAQLLLSAPVLLPRRLANKSLYLILFSTPFSLSLYLHFYLLYFSFFLSVLPDVKISLDGTIR